MNLSQQQLHVLLHTLGLNQYGQGNSYRNYFVTGPKSPDHQVCSSLVDLEMMANCGHAGPITNYDDVFRATPKGECAAREQSPPAPKLTRSQNRYRQFLSADSDMSFGEWLKAKCYVP
jgi:hypothetical protein